MSTKNIRNILLWRKRKISFRLLVTPSAQIEWTCCDSSLCCAPNLFNHTVDAFRMRSRSQYDRGAQFDELMPAFSRHRIRRASRIGSAHQKLQLDVVRKWCTPKPDIR